MTIWMVIWAGFSSFFLLFLLWTLQIVILQKAAWKKFATKYKLRFRSKSFMKSPEMHGVIDGHKVSFFSSEHSSDDMRSTRNLIAIEVPLDFVMPAEAAIVSGGMIKIATLIGFQNELKPKHEKWSEEYAILTQDKAIYKAYLTKERLSAIIELMEYKSAMVMVIFKKDLALLRIDVSDPLKTIEKLEELKGLIMRTEKVLEVSDAELKMLKEAKTLSKARDVALEFDDEQTELTTGLSLEDDEDVSGDKADGSVEEAETKEA